MESEEQQPGTSMTIKLNAEQDRKVELYQAQYGIKTKAEAAALMIGAFPIEVKVDGA